jgi:hypothetical protein
VVFSIENNGCGRSLLMLKKISVFAISVGLFAGAAFFIASGPSGVQAQEDALACAARPVALDEGYGVTRVEMRPSCDPRRSPFGGL